MDEISATEDDRELVSRAKAGSQAAFTDLVNKYYERIYRISFRILHHAEEAEEVTQETFARAVQALERFDFRASFYTWLVSIARNASFDALRALQRRARFKHSDDNWEHQADEATKDPVGASAQSEASQLVHKALGRLNARDRTLLVLRDFEDLQYAEIARVLGCSVGTIESGIHRARKKLKYYLGALEPTWSQGR